MRNKIFMQNEGQGEYELEPSRLMDENSDELAKKQTRGGFAFKQEFGYNPVTPYDVSVPDEGREDELKYEQISVHLSRDTLTTANKF